MAAPFWDPRSDADHLEMASLLAPLIVASRDRNFIDKGAAKAQTYAWRLSMADVPRPILEEAIANMVRRGVTWMPRPGDVKAECAKVMAAKRQAAIALHLDSCEHPRQFEEFTDRNGVVRNRKCSCWKRAQHAADLIGQAILPPSREETRELES